MCVSKGAQSIRADSPRLQLVAEVIVFSLLLPLLKSHTHTHTHIHIICTHQLSTHVRAH